MIVLNIKLSPIKNPIKLLAALDYLISSSLLLVYQYNIVRENINMQIFLKTDYFLCFLRIKHGMILSHQLVLLIQFHLAIF